MRIPSFAHGIAWAFVVALVCVSASFAQSVRTQDFTTDPGWGAVNNTASPLNYGFRNTSHITGSTAGEAGGAFSRTNIVNYYADTNLTENLREWFTLQASGKLTADTFTGFDGGIQLGYFSQIGVSFLGFSIAEPSPAPSPFRVALAITLGNGTTRSSVFPAATLVTGKDYNWNFTYDPAGAGGNGELTATLTGIDVVYNNTFSVALSPGDKGPGFAFDSFGLRSAIAGGTSGTADFFIDNLTYTIPEPSVAALSTMCGILFLRRRRS